MHTHTHTHTHTCTHTHLTPQLMERNYNHSNAYHDSTHAADVLQAIAYMINLLQDHLISQGVGHMIFSQSESVM